jgi:hypothetical protein
MVPFSIIEVEEYVDGRVAVTYETVADDDLPLIETDVFTPDPTTDLEEALTEWLTAKKTWRAEINARPKPEAPAKPKVKRTTAVLDDQAVNRVRSQVEE